jgi:aspartokinase-like uncharacterized kinase
MIVLKVGGSLFDMAPGLLRRVKALGADVLVVPGGGEFADVVRRIDRENGLSADAAHWMAVLAMDEYAYYLSDKTGIELTGSLAKKKGTRIALPYEILKANDALPHTWDVTSDTIAAWIAVQMKCPLVKATDVDGIIINGALVDRIEASRLIGMETCVDRALPEFLIAHAMGAFIVNGRHAGRVEKAIMGEPTAGTAIIGK